MGDLSPLDIASSGLRIAHVKQYVHIPEVEGVGLIALWAVPHDLHSGSWHGASSLWVSQQPRQRRTPQPSHLRSTVQRQLQLEHLTVAPTLQWCQPPYGRRLWRTAPCTVLATTCLAMSLCPSHQ